MAKAKAKKKTMAKAKPAARKAGDFYPPIKPYNTGFLKVSPIHEIYYEESGNPKGKPVVFLHGGPGGGTDAKMRQFFNPKKYRIVLFDQRGCGKSRPPAWRTTPPGTWSPTSRRSGKNSASTSGRSSADRGARRSPSPMRRSIRSA